MPPLTAGNSRVKEARKLSRRSERSERRLFLVDGPKAVEGALELPERVVEVFATPEAATRYADLLAGAPVTLVDDRALASLSDTVTPAGIVAVCRFFDVDALGLVADGRSPVVVCADVRDPGNAGTIIRTADAVDAAGVVLCGSSVDPYNEKTVRATAGSLFHVPLSVVPDTAGVVARLQSAGYRVLAADGAGEVDLFSADELLRGRIAWLFGNEAWGLPDELATLADHRVAIPIPGRAESLNLATAAAVCLYASARAASRRTLEP
jgi:TrmH family RNA methyltransferase